MPVEYTHDHENEITLFAETNFRNARRRFGIKTDDRRRHVYIIGKTGMGKTTLMENMILSDILAGHGVCYVDPHGDTAEKILDYIPSHRINDVVYFNPSDMDFPVGFNILETVDDDKKHLVASGLMGVFKKIWPDVWSPRMEYILLNCVLALLDYPGATLLGINRLLVDKEYRKRVIAKIRDPIVKTFWVAEFAQWSEKYATEAIAPVQNKVGQFLSASIIRNIVAQVKSTIDLRSIMDDGKILIVNLSKGKIGEDNMRLLGGMLITKLQMAAMERVDIPVEADRRDFYLFVDEFQNFANESFASILSEARKYRLNLIVANQYIKQLDEKVCWAVFGNVGTIITFRVGADDAAFMENEFMPTFTPEDLVNLSKYQVYLKLMVDGAATSPFSANTLSPIAQRTNSVEKVIAVSRERYAAPRPVIEEKVLRWSGMETGEPGSVQYPEIMTEEEQTAREERGGVPAALKPGTPEYASASIEALEGDGESADSGEYLRISPERLSAISKPQGNTPKKEKPKFSHTCTRCGKVWDMPIQLDTSRPVFCAECLPIIREERKMKSGVLKAALRGGTPKEANGVVVDVAPSSKSESKLRNAFSEIDKKDEKRPEPPRQSHAPRVVGERQQLPPEMSRGTVKIVKKDPTEESESLLAELQASKGKPIERNKERLTDRHVDRPDRREGERRTGERREDRDRRDHGRHQKPPHKANAQPAQRDARPPQQPAATRIEQSVMPPAPSATVFKSTVSAVRTPETPKLEPEKSASDSDEPHKLSPGQRITF